MGAYYISMVVGLTRYIFDVQSNGSEIQFEVTHLFRRQSVLRLFKTSQFARRCWDQ